uniref:Uncharacterized protein n=1 Tax=Oryza glaberrima TaxID=4538 RepID=I1R5D1_ORYGL
AFCNSSAASTSPSSLPMRRGTGRLVCRTFRSLFARGKNSSGRRMAGPLPKRAFWSNWRRQRRQIGAKERARQAKRLEAMPRITQRC